MARYRANGPARQRHPISTKPAARPIRLGGLSACFSALYLLAFAALAVHAPAAVWQPGHRDLHLRARLDRRLALELGRRCISCRSLWYRRRVFPRWRAQAERLAATTETAAELLAPRGVPRRHQLSHPGRDLARRLHAPRSRRRRATRARSRSSRPWSRWPISGWSRTCSGAWRRRRSVRLILVRGTGDRQARRRWPGRCGAVAAAGTAPGCRGAGAGRRRRAAARAASRAPCRSSGCCPSLGALTTDEDCLVPEVGAAMRAWHRLRFAQRHLLMCVAGAVAAADHADRADVGLPRRDRDRSRASSS